jgi:hypothetical protein
MRSPAQSGIESIEREQEKNKKDPLNLNFFGEERKKKMKK